MAGQNIDMTLPGETTSVSLTQLAYLRRLQKYQKRKSDQVERRLRRLETSCEVRKRILKNAQRLQHGLAESIQSGNKRQFSSLYHAFQTAKQACEEYAAQSSNTISLESLPSDRTSKDFLEELLPDARDVLLDLLSRIASDADFLLDRLLHLSRSEFSSLVRPLLRRPDGLPLSGGSPRKFQDGLDQEPMKEFLDLSRHDPIFSLLEIVGKVKPLYHGTSYPYPIDAWGTICAGLLSHQQPGSEKFVIAIMNAHLKPLGKTARNHLETWFMEMLRDGDFLLDKPEKHTFKMRLQTPEGSDTEDKEATESFYLTALKGLLRILKDTRLTGVIPASVLDLGNAIVNKMEFSSRHRQAAPYFLCAHWLISSYIASLVRSPESHGLLLSYHVPTSARQRILNEIALRTKSVFFDVAYSWKNSDPVHANLFADVEAIVDLFRSPQPDMETQAHHGSGTPYEGLTVTQLNHLIFCSSDLLSMIRALYPERKSSLFQSTYSLSGSTIRSSASSVSGMSLFGTGSPSDDGSPGAINDTTYPVHSPTTPGPKGLFDNILETLSDFDSDSYTFRLREACNELSLIAGHDPDTSDCDPFSERWSTLKLCPGDRVKYPGDVTGDCAHARPDSLLNPVTVHGTSDVRTSLDFPSQGLIQTGVLALLDDYVTPDGVYPKDAGGLLTLLIQRLEHASTSCYQQADFSRAHSLLCTARKIRSLPAKLTVQAIPPAFNHLADDFRQSIDRSHRMIRYYEIRSEELNELTERHVDELRDISQIFDRMREKMWYVTDIQSASQYEDLRRVASALRIMGSPVRSPSEKPQPNLRHRTASRSFNQDMQLKAEAATLELLSAPVGRGGPNKLSDVQSRATSHWIQTYGIENVCKAEERLHRFCQEIRRCLDCFIGDTATDTPILWSSELFQNQKFFNESHRGGNKVLESETSALKRLQNMYIAHGPSYHLPNIASQWGRSATPIRSMPRASLSPRPSTHDYFGSRSPTLTHKSSTTFWSTFSPGAQSPSSATSLPSRTLSPTFSERPLSRQSRFQQAQALFLEDLKQNLTALLLSDFGHLFREGSETDRALRDPLNGRMRVVGTSKTKTQHTMQHAVAVLVSVEKHDAMDVEGTCDEAQAQRYTQGPVFDFEEVFRKLLTRFETQPSPYLKLDALLELQTMLKEHDAEFGTDNEAFYATISPEHNEWRTMQDRTSLRIDTRMAPRTPSGQDSIILGFRRLFRDPQLRPKTLFRDLQYIASLVPLHTLDNTARGRAFWNATIAALDLKQGICQSFIETADQIISYHTFNRGHSRVTSTAQAKRDHATFAPEAQHTRPDIADLSMSDAATLLQAAAKEGIPAAQRELATLYLTHPEVLSVCLAPLSRPADVFKTGVEVAGRKGTDKERERMDRERYDPIAMAVAQHWMQISAKGGDGPAAKYLRAKDEFEKIP